MRRKGEREGGGTSNTDTNNHAVLGWTHWLAVGQRARSLNESGQTEILAHYSNTSAHLTQSKQVFALRERVWYHSFFLSTQVLLRFPWCLQMVQCLQSMCLLDTFHKYALYTIFSVFSLASCWTVSKLYICPLCTCLFPQIIEENGVRRVLVLPQQPEFHPGGHSPLHHPPPPPHAHLPAFIPHPAMMPPPPHLYTGMAGGVGDMSSQYISQYHPAHIYSEQGESESAVSIWVVLLS